jgi:hypothetical protein
MSKPHETPIDAVTGATDSEEPPSAADALAIIEQERSRTAAGLTPNLALLYGAWGLAWLAGFGISYVTDADILHLSPGVAITVVAATFALAVVISIVQGVRAGRGVRGPSERTGAMYGFSWMIAFIGMGLLLAGISMPEEIASVIYPAAFVLLTGAMYLFGGTLWNDRIQYALGTWLIVVAAASTFIGHPGNYLALAIGGAGGLLAIAVYYALRDSTR